MQLPDETLEFHCQGALIQANVEEEWSPLRELQTRHLLSPSRLKEIAAKVDQVRSQLAAERETARLAASPSSQPAFLDLPERLVAELRHNAAASELGRIQAVADQLRDKADRVIVVGGGVALQAARAVFQAFANPYHNDLSVEARMGRPRVYFVDLGFDNDSWQDLLALLQTACVNPDLREERWAVLLLGVGVHAMSVAAALRVLRREAEEYYGSRSPLLGQLFVLVAGEREGDVHHLARAAGIRGENLFSVPHKVGDRFSAFTAVSLLPAALMGLDVRAMLMGAAAMTRHFLDQAWERNLPLQLATLCHLLHSDLGKTTRWVLAWSSRLSALAQWYAELLAQTSRRRGQGITAIALHANAVLTDRAPGLWEGARGEFLLHLGLAAHGSSPLSIGMAERNDDGLNAISRRTFPELHAVARKLLDELLWEHARPQASVVLPTLNEHTFGQLMQMLMIATVMEARLLGVSPYPGGDAFRRRFSQAVHSLPNVPAAAAPPAVAAPARR
jgi:glucose-6-phosphate isomerase